MSNNRVERLGLVVLVMLVMLVSTWLHLDDKDGVPWGKQRMLQAVKLYLDHKVVFQFAVMAHYCWSCWSHSCHEYVPNIEQ